MVSSIETYIARFFAYIFHPLFMPTYGLGFIYLSNSVNGFNRYSSPELQTTALKVMFWIFLFTSILPTIIAFILKKRGVISSLHMPKQSERPIPFLLTLICYSTSYLLIVFVLKLKMNPLLHQFIIFAILSVFFAMVISFYYKVSVHMLGIGGIVGIFFYLSKSGGILEEELLIALIAATLTAFSRLALNAHTLKQVVSGFLIGFMFESGLLLLN